jgi:hypothetical protein
MGHWNKGSSFLTTRGKLGEVKAIITGRIDQEGLSSFDLFFLSEMNLMRRDNKDS